jgi:methionyl-tRNA synthetase
MPWGIPVPGDDEHVMYVWFDALVNYISTLGWPEDTENFEKYWKQGQAFQYAGKDNLRQQSAMWQAMLMAAGLPTTKKIRINGFINGSGGVKMSKSLGNVISPFDVVEKYGTDALRYFLLRHIPAFEDGEMSMEMFHEYYTAHLVNGLGNLASRILNLSEKYLAPQTFEEVVPEPDFVEYLESGEFGKALDLVWKKIDLLNEYISEQEPFKVIKVDEQKGREVICKSVVELYSINEHLSLFLPATYAALHKYIVENKKPEIGLFPRL